MIKRAIPSFITSLNLACGVLALLSGDLWLGSIFILSGAFLDLFDGLFARILNAQSSFGKELDSLADVITFGLAPAVLYHSFAPDDSIWIYTAPILISLGAALRLAKFNVFDSGDSYFSGMATPASAVTLIGVFIGIHYNETWIVDWFSIPVIYIGFAGIIFALNLIPLKMFSVKSVKDYKVARIFLVILIIGMLYFYFSVPTMALLLASLLYIGLSVIFHFLIT